MKDKESLASLFIDLLEKQAFMFVDWEDDGDFSAEVEMPIYKASLTFKGAFEGEIALYVPDAPAHELAANILGVDMDDELVEHGLKDALGEMLNVICGNALTTIAGEVAVFDLMIPVVTTVTQEEWDTAAKNENILIFSYEDSAFMLYLQTEEQ